MLSLVFTVGAGLTTALIIVACVIAAVIIICAIWTISVHNGLVKRRNRVQNGFSQIDIQCKKRFDLVPNLVEIVKGYAKHEKDTLESVIHARNTGTMADSPAALAAADDKLTRTLGSLFALSEAYPDLKANANFLRLQNELISLEKSIAISRGFYNDAVMMYNNAIMVFPSSIIAKAFKFEKSEFFSISDKERGNISVSLD